jgi:DNA (cytosine-5)-methyltransferase 1
MKFISLFAGIGGFDLGLERAGMQCVGQVEINPFCQRVLAHHWPDVKRIGDIRNVTAESFGAVELICGGFPCQPFSTAGKRKGKADDRYLWPEMLRVIQAYRHAWIIGENVAGIVSMELGTVLSDLEAQGYQCQSFIVPACAVDAKHERKRVWIVAHSPQRGGERNTGGLQSEDVSCSHSSGCGERRRAESVQQELYPVECFGQDVPDTDRSAEIEIPGDNGEVRGFSKTKCKPEHRTSLFTGGCRWEPEPGVGRVANGVPGRVGRLRSLGNAVVPQVVEVIGTAIRRAHVLCAERLPDIKDARLTAYNSASAT